jgi:hypothetical protein
MFGAKAEAPAVVIDVEEQGRGMSRGDLKFRFVLEARPADGQPFRLLVDHTFLWSDARPKPGETVTVEYEVRHPDKAKLVLDGDPRFDRKQVRERGQAEESARQAQLEAEVEQEPGGSPPTG